MLKALDKPILAFLLMVTLTASCAPTDQSGQSSMVMVLIPGIVGGLIGGGATIVGLFVANSLSRRREDTARTYNYVERQVNELYTPLFGLLEQITRTYSMRERFMDTTNIKLPRPEIEFYFYESFFAPLHEKAIDLIYTKESLFEEGRRPSIVDRYLLHAIHQKIIYNAIKDLDERSSYSQQFGWPQGINTEVSNTLDKLREQQGINTDRNID